jgi:Tol biopolymer transport system component
MTDVELEVAESFERVFPVPTVVADWDDVLDRAGARSGTPTRPPSRWRVVAIAAAIVAGVALLATPALGLGDRLLGLIQSKRSPLDVQAPAWSRDGRTIVFVSWRDGNGEVYAMDADGSEPRNLTQHPARDVRPAWSPDGRRITFVSRRDGNSEVYVMDADGSGKRNLTRDRASDDDHPTWSPDGRRIAFLRGRPHCGTRGPRTTPRRCVFRFFLYDLYVVNADGSGLRRLSLRLPEGTPQTTGRPTAFDRTLQAIGGQLVWSPHGRTIYFGRYLVSTDGSGARRLPYIPLRAVWSPDGRRIAFTRMRVRTRTRPGPCCNPSATDIYVMNADGSGTRKLTHDKHYNAEPAWSPDGRKIAFRSTRNGNREIYVMNADGSNQRNLTRNPAKDVRPSWSPDGRRIAFVSDRDGRLEAHVMNADGSGQRSLAQQSE